MSKVSEKIVESSTFNLLGVYFSFGLGISNTFLTARLLIPEEWAIIILTINLIYICVFVCNLFPPNAQDSINYYIPHLMETNEKNEKSRGFIFHVYKIRLFSAGIVFFLYVIIAFLANFEKKILQIILIMSPIVLFDILKNLNRSVLLAFQRFKKIFIIDLIYPLTITIGLFSIYCIGPRNPIILVGYVNLFGSISSCIISLILISPLIPSKKREIEPSIDYKQDYLSVHKKYGVNLTIADIFTQLSFLVIYFMFVEFNLLLFITWLTICEISVTSALYFSSSNPSAYISIFSEINIKEDPEKFKYNFYQLNKFLMLFVCIIVGIMIFFVELYVAIIYSDTYIILIFMLQIYLISTFSRIIIRNLFILTQSTNNTRLNAIIMFIQMGFNIIISIFALVFFSFRALILGYLITSYLVSFIAIYLVNKKLDIKLKLRIFYKPLIVFLISFIIVFPLGFLISFRIILGFYYINYFVNNLIKFILFVLVFYVIFYFTRVLTKEEFSQLIEIVPILNSQKKIIQKLVKIIEKFLPSGKNKNNQISE